MRAPRPASFALAIAASGLAGALLVAGSARRTPGADLAGPVADGSGVGRTRAWFTATGFYPGEFDRPAGRHFSWTGARASIVVPAIDRSQSYRIRLRIAAGRGPTVVPPPELVVTVDDIPRLRGETTNAPAEYDIIAPPGSGSTLTVALELSNTFVPGPDDRRALGVVVESVSIEPIDGRFRPLISVLVLAALAVMGYALAAACCGFSAVWTLAIGLGVAYAHAWLLGHDAAFLGLYAPRLVRISLGVAALGALVGFARWRWPGGSSPEWPLAAGFAVLAGGLKLAFFSHAAATIADAIFQVHRAQDVMAGHYFFTSITPRPFFEFPYAIALYVAAMPFWTWFPTELDRVVLLRGLSIAADAAIGVAMYATLRRAWGAPRPALFFAALWPLALAPQVTLCTANLTNLFGQGMFGVAMGLAGWMAAGTRARAAGLVAFAALLAVGFLSHFSTLSVGVPLVGLVAIMLGTLGRGSSRRLGVWLVVALVAAIAVSYVLYYSHFHDVYARTLARVTAGEGQGVTQSMAAPVSVKFARWRLEMQNVFGLPVIVAAVAGAVWLVRRHRRDGLTAVFAGWGLTWILFSALAVFTAVEMRASLAAAPLMLALAVGVLDALARGSRAGTIVAGVTIAAIAWSGWRAWLACLTS